MNAISVTIDNTVYPFMCTYNDGKTMFLLSTKAYKESSGPSQYLPNAIFTLNGKSYTKSAFVPTFDELKYYTTPSSRERDEMYWTQTRKDVNYYYGIGASGKRIEMTINANSAVYLAIKITA